MQELTNDIFSIIKVQHTEGQLTASLAINDDSPIFKGHFPNQPVVPGACILQLIKDVLEDVLKTPLQLKKADHLKFISMIVPGNEQLALIISYKIIDDEIMSTVKLTNADAVSFKFQGSFVGI